MIDFARARAAQNARVAAMKPTKRNFKTELELVTELIDESVGNDELTEWEEKFTKSLFDYLSKPPAEERRLSDKQRIVLLKLCTKTNTALYKSPSQLQSPPAPTLESYNAARETFAKVDDDDDIPF